MNLIANELVIVQPMSSVTGYVAYVQYTAGSTKGATTRGDVLNSPFKLGNVDSTYTSSRTVDTFATFTSGTSKVSWTPVVPGTIRALDANGVEVSDNATTPWTVSADGTITQGAYVSSKSATDVKKIAYVYDNVVIPQNDIPTVNAEMKSIPLLAKARRVAVYYSQIASYQAKQDYGFDLGAQLSEKAVGQLSYEIDTEVTDLLIDHAEDYTELHWSKTLPVGVSKADHYEGFTEIVEIARQKIYDATKRFAPNYMLCASDLLPVLTFIKGFTSATPGQINGPYFAGTLNGLKVFVTPNIAPGKFVIGVNGNDMMSSAAVYAPYMSIVPTQLLQYADGGTSQGWSTMYDLKALNTYEKDGHEYSNLLVSGQIFA